MGLASIITCGIPLDFSNFKDKTFSCNSYFQRIRFTMSRKERQFLIIGNTGYNRNVEVHIMSLRKKVSKRTKATVRNSTRGKPSKIFITWVFKPFSHFQWSVRVLFQHRRPYRTRQKSGSKRQPYPCNWSQEIFKVQFPINSSTHYTAF